MPKAFNDCRAAGGRIRTVSGPNKKFGLSEGQYVHVCIHKGKFVRGEVKTNHREKAMKSHG